MIMEDTQSDASRSRTTARPEAADPTDASRSGTTARPGAADPSALAERRVGLSLAPEHREELVELYRQMMLIRRFEERVGEMYTRARIGGYTHLNIGEEAAIVGSLSALRPDDYVFTNYREHGHALLRGIPPETVMAELFGKATGSAKGRGGSMHLFDLNRRFMGGYAIVGGSLPLSVGVGLAIDYRGGDEIVYSLFGEGTTNIGGFYESMNLAKLWKLPVLFFCNNNQYAMGSRPGDDSAVAEVHRKACAFDMIAEVVDGTDVLAVREAADRLVRHVRESRDPVLLEVVSYRLRGHSMADPARYRSPEEVQRWADQDPIGRFYKVLSDANLIDADQSRQLEAEIEDEVERAVQFAESSASPDPATLFDDIYANSPQLDGTEASGLAGEGR